MTDRRDFLKKVGLGVAGLATAGLVNASRSSAAKKNAKFKWKIAAAFPLTMVGLGPGVARFAKNVTELSGGELEITAYGAGELVPAMQVFDATKQGSVIQMAASASYYWIGKMPASGFFTNWPFGMDSAGMMSWMYNGGGLELWRELYAPSGVVPFPFMGDGMQMAGWFRKEIKSVDDLKGLKYRCPGIGGQVYARAGANVVTIPTGELYTALERGIVDAVKMANPIIDMPMGYHQVAKYYYYPGWNEPGVIVELLINKKAWEYLPAHLQKIIDICSREQLITTFCEFEAGNAKAIQGLLDSKKVELRKFPDDVIKLLKKHSIDIMNEAAAKDPSYKKIYDAAKAYNKMYNSWENVTKFAMTEKIY
ncbi:MAG: TRAP transporter substrate-binding protein [Deltaproteobacteria bacterium]|nr:TRAP transporter substrate-binding protein [Deltaproteobacteria bacterium]